MSERFRFLIAIGTILLGVLAGRAHAQFLETPGRAFPQAHLDLLRMPFNQTGFTLGDLFDQKLWIAVKNPLRLDALNQIDESVHRAPHPGVQFELLAPGNAGITIHLRW